MEYANLSKHLSEKCSLTWLFNHLTFSFDYMLRQNGYRRDVSCVRKAFEITITAVNLFRHIITQFFPLDSQMRPFLGDLGVIFGKMGQFVRLTITPSFVLFIYLILLPHYKKNHYDWIFDLDYFPDADPNPLTSVASKLMRKKFIEKLKFRKKLMRILTPLIFLLLCPLAFDVYFHSDNYLVNFPSLLLNLHAMSSVVNFAVCGWISIEIFNLYISHCLSEVEANIAATFTKDAVIVNFNFFVRNTKLIAGINSYTASMNGLSFIAALLQAIILLTNLLLLQNDVVTVLGALGGVLIYFTTILRTLICALTAKKVGSVYTGRSDAI